MTAGLEPDVDHGRWVLVQILLRIELEWDIEGATFRRGMLGKMYAERLSNVSVGSWVIFVETFRKQRETFFFPPSMQDGMRCFPSRTEGSPDSEL